MKTARVIILLAAIIVSSGCASNDTGQNGITVQSISVEPKEIRTGNDVTVSAKVENTGLLEGDIYAGEENGNNILTNYCPDYFNVAEFTASKEGEGNSYTLKEGDLIEFNWRLNQYNKDKIPMLEGGMPCDLKFQIPFNYSARAYKQIQVLEDDDVKTETKLASEVTSGPFTFDMRLIGGLSDKSNTIVKGDDNSIYITAYNRQREEDTKYRGIVERGDIKIDSSGLFEIDKNCLDNPTLADGDEEIYRCDLNISEEFFNPPSSRGEITLKSNYTYVRDIGERTVTVKHRGR